MICVLSD